ncbi:diiron oxygenase [Streptomyces sp. NPDC059552]|uniref:diiron oxygenase n=1 Tax=Streptomyces sp. NPDC059552 TaxID=3346862 RepID=UPI0036871241
MRNIRLEVALSAPSSQHSGDATSFPSAHYRSKFANWDRRASVRVKERRALDSVEPGQVYFPPELAPVVAHPLVKCLPGDAVRRLLIHRLYQYLHFTSELEAVAVIPVATNISRRQVGIQLPSGMQEDAFKIVTDEAWHAQFSFDLIKQVERETGVRGVLPASSSFIEDLGSIRRRLDPGVRGASDLAFSIVSETLISSMLSYLPKDRRLPAAVRSLVGDHAEDEGKHHAYFQNLLEYFWPALSVDERRRLGPWLPDLIAVFLEPDYLAIRLSLSSLGFSQAEVEQILIESYPAATVRSEMAQASKSTIRYFAEVGALDDSRTREAFLLAGLIPTS